MVAVIVKHWESYPKATNPVVRSSMLEQGTDVKTTDSENWKVVEDFESEPASEDDVEEDERESEKTMTMVKMQRIQICAVI